MSNLLSQASLVMIPSGYKEDVVYSPVPTDGSGDLTFTRASNGTRINSAGLVEVCPWNLVEYSEDFSNAVWVKQNAIAVTANTTTAPNGTTTADTLEKASGSGGVNYYYIVTSTNSFEQLTNFFYVKHKSGSGIVWLLGKNTGTFAFFDVINGTALSKSSGMTTSVESVGNGWYKCIFSQSYVGATSTEFGIGLCLVDGTPNYDATSAATQSVYIWGAQSAVGSTAKPYFPTTDRLNVPRLTYQNGGGGCPSLLLEKQSTNLVLHSEQFDATASWSYSECSVTANQTISPDGTQNADKLVENSANTIHEIYQGLTLTSGTAYTNTIYAKSAERTQIAINFVSGGFGQGSQVIANLSTGTLGTITNYGGVTGSTATITNVGNGWYRISLTMTPVSTTTFYADYSPAVNGNAFYQGNGTSGIYIWGAQLEASSYPTSYIPTTSSSATRVADLGANDVFGSTYTLDADFCLFQDFECFDFGNGQVFWSGGNYGTGGDYRSYMIAYTTGNIVLFGVNEVATAQLTAFTFSTNTRYKVAVRRVGSTINWFVNGTKYSNASGTTTTTVKIRSISGASLGGQSTMKLNEAIIFEDKTLTDDDCISLTTI